MFKFILCLFITILFVQSGYSKKLKFRAREHYEVHKLKTDSGSNTYRGFTNSLNIWYEKPYDFLYGLVLSPIIPIRFSTDDVNAVGGKKILLINFGLEAKYFPKVAFEKLYLRGGLGYTFIDTDEKKDLSGGHLYLGLGYEVPFKKFGLALEFAVRRVVFVGGVTDTVVTPSIGFHFYDAF